MGRSIYLFTLMCVVSSCSTDAPTAIDKGPTALPPALQITDDEHLLLASILQDASGRVLGGVAEEIDASSPAAAFERLANALEQRDRAQLRQQLASTLAIIAALEENQPQSAARPDIESLKLHLARMDAMLATPAGPSPTTTYPLQEQE